MAAVDTSVAVAPSAFVASSASDPPSVGSLPVSVAPSPAAVFDAASSAAAYVEALVAAAPPVAADMTRAVAVAPKIAAGDASRARAGCFSLGSDSMRTLVV